MIIHGGAPLRGTVTLSGSKNAALPIMMASLLTCEPLVLSNVPRLRDVKTAMDLLVGLGVQARWTRRSSRRAARRERHLARSVLRPGQDDARVVLRARPAAGADRTRAGLDSGRMRDWRAAGEPAYRRDSRARRKIQLRHGYVEAHADQLTGARIWLDSPSVGATENIMMAAVTARGRTVIENAAREPEVQDLARVLVAMGANISGAGTHVIEIEGVERLHGAEHEVIPDRIEAGLDDGGGGDHRRRRYDCERAGRASRCGHRQVARGGRHRRSQRQGLRVARGTLRLKSVELRTLPYPGFPTDLQAQMMAMLTQADGTSVITETIFENRFMHAQELVRMGADIVMKGPTAVVRGPSKLSGAPVMATDLRASMGLIIAGLAAEHTTEISRVYHLDRGYEALDAKLSQLGARIERAQE